MSKAKTITLIFGWWGIPFGPIFSLGSIFGSSDGKIPSDINAAYLRNLGVYFIRNGDLKNAREALQASLKYEHNEEVANLYSHVFNDSTTETPQGVKTKTSQDAKTKTTQDVKVETGGKGDVVFGAVMATILFLALAGIVFMYRPGGPGHQSLAVDQSGVPAVAATATDNPLPTATQEPTSTSTPEPAVFGVAKNTPIAIREGPGNQYQRVQKSFYLGEKFLVLGQYANCQWLEISTDKVESAWILMDDTQITLSIDCLSISPAAFRPEDTVIYQSSTSEDLGKFVIVNSSTADAVVYISPFLDSPTAIAYVRSSQTFTIENIPDGSYSVYVRSGSNWTGKKFLFSEILKRFEDPFDFVTAFEADGDTYDIWTVKLAAVYGGNAATEIVEEEAFPEIPDY